MPPELEGVVKLRIPCRSCGCMMVSMMYSNGKAYKCAECGVEKRVEPMHSQPLIKNRKKAALPKKNQTDKKKLQRTKPTRGKKKKFDVEQYKKLSKEHDSQNDIARLMGMDYSSLYYYRKKHNLISNK